MPEIVELDAHGQAELIRSGDASPADLLEAAIARIEQLNPLLNAVSDETFAHAREAAAKANRAAPFAGVPYLLKASMEYPGLPVVCGSRARVGSIGKRKFSFADRLDAAGLIACGMSAMPEFGLIGTGEGLLNGPTCNPWNVAHGAGGSSSGAAAAVASRMVPLATGSDGGGSIRIPAAHCGVIGFKPSRDWNVRARAPALIDDLLVSDMLLGRSMRDIIWAAHHLRTQSPGTMEPTRPLRVALCLRGLDGSPSDSEVAEGIGRAASMCESLGHIVEPSELPLDLGALQRAFGIIWSYGAGEVVDLCRVSLGDRTEEVLEPWTIGLAQYRSRVAPEDLAAAFSAVANIRARLEAVWGKFDVVLGPIAGSPAPPLGLLAPDRPFDDLWRDHFRHVNYTQLQNMGGLPGIALPLAWSASGLPVGAHFWTLHGGDDLLLALGAALEQAFPWENRKPPLAPLGNEIASEKNSPEE